jgi:hypothetical protein
MNRTERNLWARLGNAQKLTFLREIGYRVDDPSVTSDGWIEGLVAPSCLGGAYRTFAVNLQTGEAVDRKLQGYRGDIVDVAGAIRGMRRAEVRKWLATFLTSVCSEPEVTKRSCS